MIRKQDLLDNLHIASPCPTSWNEMEGDDRVRHCSLCRLNVYNLSDMTRKDAEKLLRDREGRLCVRYYKRADGTMITRDCPIGLRTIRRKMRMAWAVMVAMLFGGGCKRAVDNVNTFLTTGKLPTQQPQAPPSTVVGMMPIAPQSTGVVGKPPLKGPGPP